MQKAATNYEPSDDDEEMDAAPHQPGGIVHGRVNRGVVVVHSWCRCFMYTGGRCDQGMNLSFMEPCDVVRRHESLF